MAKIANAPHHHQHHPVAHKPAAAKPHGHGTAIAVTLAVVALAVAGGLWWANRPGGGAADPAETLLDQMHLAAGGSVYPTHAFGGALSVSHGNGRLNVTAEGLPPKACVQVGWHLAKEGTIIVNGVLPMRLSAAKLSDLCAEREGGSTLVWVPDEAR